MLSDDSSVNLDDVALVIRKRTPIQLLPGYSKATHRIPETNDRRSQEFVARLGARLIREDLDHAFVQLRDGFGFKRRDLQVTESEEGFGTIETPFFVYSNYVFQSDDDVSDAIWQRDISRIVEPDVLLDDGCNRLFPNTFDTVEFVPAASIDLEKLIDHIEDLPDDRVSADYDRHLTYCKVLIKDSAVYIRVTSDAFRVVHPTPTTPRELVTCIRDVRQNLVDFTKLTK